MYANKHACTHSTSHISEVHTTCIYTSHACTHHTPECLKSDLYRVTQHMNDISLLVPTPHCALRRDLWWSRTYTVRWWCICLSGVRYVIVSSSVSVSIRSALSAHSQDPLYQDLLHYGPVFYGPPLWSNLLWSILPLSILLRSTLSFKIHPTMVHPAQDWPFFRKNWL